MPQEEIGTLAVDMGRASSEAYIETAYQAFVDEKSKPAAATLPEDEIVALGNMLPTVVHVREMHYRGKDHARRA